MFSGKSRREFMRVRDLDNVSVASGKISQPWLKMMCRCVKYAELLMRIFFAVLAQGC